MALRRVPQLALWLVLLSPLALAGAGQGLSTRSPHGNLATPCQNCHTQAGWKPIRAVPEFDHNKTSYPLRGMHQDVPCVQCHTKLVFSNVGTKCADCHADIHRRQFGANCESCHSVKGWRVSIQQIQQHENRFPLIGAHATVDCDSCHKGAATGQFQGLSTQCYSCHSKEYQQTTNPNHVAGKFSTSCEQCHSMNNWLNAKFDHSTTGFPLTGAHTAPPRECIDCHVNNNYNITTTTCASCHMKDFQGTTNPNHVQGGFPQTCEQCHTTTTWAGATFDHNKTGFPLSGAHTTPPRQCVDCHVNNNYNITTTTCVSCHLKDFQATKNPNHVQGGFAQTCEQCHTTTSWSGAKFDHSTTGFALTGSHMVPPRQCVDCHVNNNYNITVTTCVSCHLKDYQGTKDPNHVQSGFPQTCEQCHSTTSWNGASFDHATTGFALTGSHTVPPRQCVDCHVNNNYNITVSTCVSCHLKDFQGAKSPDHVQGGFSQTCQQCHNTTSWSGATFDHATTGFPLTGAHTVPPRQCVDCHVNNNYNLTTGACVSCHLKEYNATRNPNHVQSGFAQTCEQCHSTTSWDNATFDHNTTGFPLKGGHAVPPRQCTDCHVNNNYNLTTSACVSCHLKDYQGAKDPNHVTAGFPQTCEQCHGTTSWSGASFDHATTGFALTGSHKVPPRQCTDCHVNNNYNLTTATCVSCHLKDYQGTTNPNHVTANFPQTCEQCHGTTSWSGASFDHATTGFALTGSHTVPPRQCTDCHVNNNYNLTTATCVSCHLKDYQGTKNPNHVTAGFPQTCEQCHSTSSWDGATFNHATTGFPLTGSHTVPPRQCTDCHVNNNYNLTTATCVSCHLKDFQGATNPNHVTANFPQTCETCHTTTSWDGATFNHATTGFPLTGAHTVPPRQCTDCHVNNNYNLTTTTCVSCHLKDYQGTTDPNHVAAKFSQNCETCHSTTTWDGATFNHATTGFTLTGAHTVPPRQCADCHVNNNYNITVTTCVSCHLKDYQGTTNPNHVTANFPQTCETCHSTTTWNGATFNHATTGFPLTGAHTVPPRQCTDCHVNNNYNITVTTCVSCHLKDYQGTTNPNHVTANFPQTCESCHTTTSWNGATFNHATTGFPLTGAHTVPPRQCTDCHVNNNYNITVTTCVSCHLKDYQGTTNPNHVTANFPQTCETCHTTTTWDGATFNHATTGFALTGAHTVPPRQCTDCHVNNNYNITVSTCVSCHLKDYQGTTNPNHVTAGFPQTCDSCHSTTDWTGAKFDHSTTGFALVGAHTVPPRQCTDCHVNNNYNLTTGACVSCHQQDYNNATTPVNHASAGFPTTCEMCHDTVLWTNGKFDHNTTSFPLTGSHTVPPRQCVNCHVNNNYTTLPTDCYGCHKTDYQNTTNPNHTAAGFPTTCATCHNTTQWTGATFNHTWFPQTHGNARVCSDCHTNPNDYSVFSCTNCHTKTKTDQQHQGNRNYVYNSANCYQCHPNGRS